MSFASNYEKLRKKRLQEEEENKKSSTGDIAPVFSSIPVAKSENVVPTTTSSNEALTKYKATSIEEAAANIKNLAKNKKANKTSEKRKWFDAGAFDDGYQFGDILKTISGTAADLRANVVGGALEIGEKVVDAGAYIVGGAANLFGADDFAEDTKEFIAKDLYDGEKIASYIDPSNWALKHLLGEEYDDVSVLGEKADSLAQSGGQLLGTLGLQAAGVPWFITTGVTSFGGEVESAFNEDASYLEAGVSGAIAAGAELITEKLFGGSGLGEKGLINTEVVTKNISNKLTKAFADFGIDMLSEGAEEVVSSVISRLGSNIYKKEDIDEVLLSEEAFDEYLEGLIGGAVLGGTANVGKVGGSVKTAKKYGLDSVKDYRTGLTSNEETVVNKEVEKRIAEKEANGEKVTNKEKAEIYDKVVKDLDKGYISIDTIEEALGGESYTNYKNSVDAEDSIMNELKSLRDEYNELNKLKRGEMTGEQVDRQNEIREKMVELKEKYEQTQANSQKDTLKQKLSEDVFGIAKKSRLVSSYVEQANRGKAFEADVSQYDENTRATVQKAIDSGILNNTNRTHEFVDTIAKISTETGVSFDFANNAKLKESGFSVDGATINGVVTKDGITLNVDSPKAWESTVGHEITHVLEGTELYTELQKSIFEYAKTKGDYDGRLQKLTKLYENVDGADINAELTADLVGDYLFTDGDFITTLSTKNRNVFQKIYDELKRLLKIVTPGTKEARQLDEVKRAFDKAYKAGGKASTDTKYSLSDSDGKTLTKEQSEFFKDSKMRDEDGNLKVMYHGSQDAGFHIFDPSMSDDNTSLFFVDRNDVAASYSGTSETYEARTIKTAEDMNNFLAEIGYDQYKAVENNGKFELLENGEHIATKDTAQEIYEEFCWYEGVGEGDANYKVYLNLKNPLVIDAEGRNWNNISREYSQEVADRYNSLTAEEKDALASLAEWGEYSIFRDEMLNARANAEQGVSGMFDEAYTRSLARAYEKLGGANANLYDAFSIATENFSEESLKEFAVKQMNTRNYAEKAKAEGYDGVIFKNIHDNGGYSNGSEGASTVAIAFSSEQIKSVANEKPTGDPDIRYSLTEYTEAEKKAHNDMAIEHFGKTYKWAETGYLLLDGTRLDLSGKHDGAPGGYRTVDHRDIADALEDGYGGGDYSGSLVQFMSEGNIRIIPEINGINMSVKPTKAQEQALSDFISRARGEVVMDIDDPNGYTVVSVEYPRGTYYTKVLNDIREWFDNGKKPETAGTYSLTKNGDTPKKHGNRYTPATELRYEGESIAPVAEDLTESTETANVTENPAPTENAVQSEFEGVPEGFAPVTEDEADAMRNESFNSLDDSDAPGEVDAPYYGDNARESVTLGKITSDNISREVGKVIQLTAEERAKLKGIIENYAQNESITEQELFDEIQRNFLYSEEISNAELDNTAIQAKNHMHGTKVYINPDKKADFVGMGYNSFNDFKQAHFGHFYITTQKTAGALSVDGLYKELSGLYPDLFPADVENVADELKIMGEVADNANATEYHEMPYDDETIREVVDIINKGISEYSEREALNYLDKSRDSYLESVGATDIAPPAEDAPKIEKKVTESENIAPEPTFDSTKASEVKGQQTMFAETEAEAEPPKVANVMTEEPEMPKRKKRILSKFRTNFLDKGAVVEDLALKTGNRELDAKYNFMRYSESRAQEYIKNNLKPIVEKVESTGKTQQFYEYAYHLHNIDRMSLESNASARLNELKGKFGRLKFKQIQAIALTEITDKTTEKTAQTIREAREYLKALDAKNKPVFGDTVTADVSREAVKNLEAENPEFKELADSVVEYNAELRKMLVDGNVISQETADLWAKMYPHYVPIRRLGKDGLGVTVPLDTRKTGINAPIKRATGGDSDILPLLDTLAMRTEQTFKAVARNNFGLELLHTFNPETESESVSVDDVFDSFDNKYDELLTEGKNGQNPTFTVFENGKRVTFDITEDIYDSLKPTSEGLKYTNKVANTASEIFRGILTEYNPVFMVNNAVKDVQDILINSQHPAKTYMRIPQAIYEMSKKGKWYQEYMANGGEQNTYFDSDNKTFKKENKKWVKAVGMPVHAIKAANNFIERLPRLAEYIESRKSGRSVEVSMLDSARVTTNFAAGGDVTKFANRNGATFLNASVQGFNQQVRNVREAKADGLKGWLKLATKVAIAGAPVLLLNNLIWDDDEEYEELSDYVKDSYYIVGKTSDGKFIRIPKGRTVAVIQSGFEQISNALTGDDEADFNRFFELAISNLAPNNPIENNIISPIIQAVNNETWYGDALVPTRLQDLPASEQFDESTDAFSKWIGETFNVSPYKVNYLLDQYSGGIGDVVLPYLTPEADGGGLIAPITDKFTTDSVMKNQNVSDFYDTVDELTKNAKSSKATDEDILKYKYMNSVSSKLSELYAEKREIQNSDLSDKEKYEAVREIQEEIVALAKESLDSYGDVDIDGSYAKVGDVHFRWYEPDEDSTAEPGWRKLDDDQLEKQEKVTKGLGISAGEYWSNKEEYDFAYEKPEKYAVAKSVGGYSAYKSYQSDLYDIKADKDEDGKSISGSRKEKVIEYVNSLDIDYGERLILFKNEYNADDTYNMDIINYLNSRDDISYEEMETILKELGFTIDSEGYIYWD